MEYRVVAKVIVVNDERQILLLRRSETDIRRPLEWDVPGGHTDEGEFAEEAAARETREEAGIEVVPKDLKLVYAVSDVVEEGLNVVWLFYIVRIHDAEVTLSSEHQEFSWKSLDQVIESLVYERQKRVFEYLRQHAILA